MVQSDRRPGYTDEVGGLAMPFRDHFAAGLRNTAAWQEVHAMWPAVIVQHLFRILPEGYAAAPRVHLGAEMEIDVAALERHGASEGPRPGAGESNGGVATAIAAPPMPTLEIETDWPDQDEFETRIYETAAGRRLVAAVEIVSPGNKDRPENRDAFVAKCVALLESDVSVSIVDMVTSRNFNLYTELLELIRRSDPVYSRNPPATYAVTCKARKQRPLSKIGIWAYQLVV